MITLEQRVWRIVSQCLEVDHFAVHNDATLAELSSDKANRSNLIFEIERITDGDITEDDAEKIITVGDLVKLAENMRGKGYIHGSIASVAVVDHRTKSADEILDVVRQAAAICSGKRIDEISKDSKLKSLGIDSLGNHEYTNEVETLLPGIRVKDGEIATFETVEDVFKATRRAIASQTDADSQFFGTDAVTVRDDSAKFGPDVPAFAALLFG